MLRCRSYAGPTAELVGYTTEVRGVAFSQDSGELTVRLDAKAFPMGNLRYYRRDSRIGGNVAALFCAAVSSRWLWLHSIEYSY